MFTCDPLWSHFVLGHHNYWSMQSESTPRLQVRTFYWANGLVTFDEMCPGGWPGQGPVYYNGRDGRFCYIENGVDSSSDNGSDDYWDDVPDKRRGNYFGNDFETDKGLWAKTFIGI